MARRPRGALDVPRRRAARRLDERPLQPAGRPRLVRRALRTGGALTVGAGVRSAALPTGHRLGDEWSVVAVGPHYARALVARQVSTGQEEGYGYGVAHRRDLVVEAGRSLLRHVTPAGSG